MNRSEVGSGAGMAIVMPTRNQATYLAEAVDSVFAQGLPGLRLWVQDGASDDGTQALLARLAERHAGLSWVSEPDEGPADALNRAFAQVLGDPAVACIGWLNSDDLYTPGALRRALDQLDAHPEQVAVYGQGRHIDAQGRPLDRYPTQGPDRPLATWADGCPICQPTMVLRREALEAILPLDATLKAAFDFDLWFKLFERFPGRIGFIDAEQACSRLHDQGITLSQRKRVMLEGLQVLQRHLGRAPGHWVQTYADELRRQLPDGDDPPLRIRLAHALVEAAQWLPREEITALSLAWRQDRAIALATRQLVIDVHPDGWMPAEATLRLRSTAPSSLLLRGRHDGPQAEALRLEAIGPDGGVQTLEVARRGPFTWRLETAARPGMTQHWRLRCTPGFVPAGEPAGSADSRELGWRLDAATLGP